MLYTTIATNENIATILIECIHECYPHATLFTLPNQGITQKAKKVLLFVKLF